MSQDINDTYEAIIDDDLEKVKMIFGKTNLVYDPKAAKIAIENKRWEILEFIFSKVSGNTASCFILKTLIDNLKNM